ncbi:YadA-like family protein [Halomonas sp. DP5N14-9]|uniref:YadA-like family protein n=1 Tax=Halomonas sp. DP5N14-9 TaxID=2859075 RepID=UPI001C99415B|nr:YadA-like family protein [Halomonas sp. DP5N14-9]MBY5943385.1 YadA-like family protein [Halomonas sp. DP5N14-9]
MVLGDSGEASASNAIAIGTNAKASVANSVALGNGATTEAVVGTTQATIAGKSYSFAGAAPTGTLSLGAAATTDSGGNAVASVERTITHVAAGRLAVTSTDAVNGSQLNATNQALGELSEGVQALGYLSDGVVIYDRGTGGTLNEGSITLAGDAGTRITNLTDATLSTDSTDAVTGRQLNATNVRVTQNEGDIANLTTNLGDIAADSVYYQAKSSGSGASASGTDSLAMGPAAVSSATNGVAIGNGAKASVANSVALGNGATTEAAVATTTATVAGTDYALAGSSPTGTVSLGTSGSERTITHVAAGRLSATSTDAVNGSQLHATNQALGDLAEGAVVYDRSDDGTLNEGSITLAGDAGTQITNLTDATLSTDSTDAVTGRQLNATNIRVTQNEGDITNLTTNLGDLSAGAVVYDRSDDGTLNEGSITLAGDAGTRITNLTDATLSTDSTDAVTGRQLNATNARVSQNEGDITNLTTNLGDIAADSIYYQANSSASGASASGTDSLAMGPAAVSSATNGVAIGNGAKASVANSVALGNGATTEAAVATTTATVAGTDYALAGSSPTGTVSVGTSGSERTITHVAAGRLSATSTDAVNGSQLHATNQALGDLADGAVVYDRGTGGTLNEGSITLAGDAGTRITNLTDATLSTDSTDAVTGRQLNATNARVSQNEGDITNLTTNLGNLAEGAVVYDRGTGGTLNEGSITLAGDAGTRITNLTDATLSTDSTDAVTGRQLNATNVRVTQNEGDIANLTTNLGDIAADSIYYQAKSSGSGASASGTDSLAMGPAAVSSATNAVSIGNGASSSVFGGVALGSGAIANREVAKVSGQIVVGNATIQYNTSDADLMGAVSVGRDGEYRQLINIADGIEDHDAVTMRQLKGAVGSLSDTGSLYFHANGGGEVDALATGEGSIAIGPDTTVNGDDAIGMGVSAKVEIGAAGAVAIGDQSHTLLEDAIAVGSTAVSSGEQAMALGAGASANQAMDVALGAQSTSQEAIGTESGIIFGEQHEYAGTNPIATVSIGDEGQERTLTHLAAGRISATSTDAVNGSQLHATNMALEEVVAYDHFNDGSVDWNHVTLKSPGRAFGGTVLGNIADGSLSDTSLEAVNGSQLHATNGRLTNLEGDVGDIQTTLDSLGGGSGNPAQNVVQYDPDSNQGKITLAGADGGTVISNLAEGDIHQGSTDAVNGGQIWDLMEDIGDLALSGQDTKYFQANSQGDAATTSAADTVAIGGGAKAQAEGGVALGDGAVADREGMKGEEEAFSHVAVESSKGAVAVGSEGGERQITHVAGGTEDTDAVNVRQLGAVQEGAVNYDRSEDGSVDYHSVSLGNGSGPTQLHNVAAGSAPTDAVNMSQLNELNRKFTSDYNQLDHKIDEVERDASAGIAALAAMGDAPYVAGKLTYHVGTGYYNGESALGVSVRRTADTGRWSVGMGIGASHGGPTIGLGISGVID